MLHILGFLFFIIIAILLIGLSIIASVVHKLFNRGKRQAGGYSYSDNKTSSEEVQPEEGEIHYRRKKLFDKDEGEYVEFEEIRD